MRRFYIGLLFIAVITLVLAGCGGGSSTQPLRQSTPQTGTVNVVVSDDSTNDWAMVGVKVLDISLVPQGGGSAVSIYTATAPAPYINLVQLDQLGEILGNANVAPGTYSSAKLTIGANPGDVLLTAAANPDTGFAGTPGAAVDPSQIQIQGATGAVGSRTVSLSVNLVTPLVVTAGSSNALDMEFDLSHPAFIVDHDPIGGGAPIWAVNFNGPVRHQPIRDITALILRHLYGSVTAVSTDNSTITVAKAFAVRPETTPETAIVTSHSIPVLADAANGTVLFDVDAKTRTVIKDFSSVAASLPTKFVRIAARYQANGTLVAVRIFASTSFNKLWISPEGHVLHVSPSTNVIVVENADGVGVPLTIDSNTQFFYRTPANALGDATPIATGTGFVQNGNIVRGFKIHASVVDPLASPLVAQTVDIEIAKYNGAISGANATGFQYNRQFATALDNYNVTLAYISNTTPNGKDSNGNAIQGYKWWNFAFPTLADTGATAIPDFVAATNGAVNFGGGVGTVPAFGVSYVTWNDPAAANTWAAKWTVLEPTKVPLGNVSSPFSVNSFGMTVPLPPGSPLPPSIPVTVKLTTTAGSATLVYQVDKTGAIVTISPQDITTTAGINALTSNLISGTPVKVFGVPQADGTIKAYTVFYYTGLKSAE
jgi:hypothetical protein